MKELTLYQFANCPFCRKVAMYLNSRKINVPEKDVLYDPHARQELINIGGKSQVPCLVIDGDALYESDAIIAWFENNWT